MNGLDKIAARQADPRNRELIDSGCEGTMEYNGCYDASVLIEAMDADLAALLAVVREVAALHRPLSNSTSAMHPAPLCACDHEWPCPTGRALQALTDTPEEN